MKKLVLLLIIFFSLPSFCFAFDFKELKEKLEPLVSETVLEKTGIDLENVTGYLDWESINLSFTADMVNTTETLGSEVKVFSKVYKKGLTNIRADLKSDILIPGGKTPIKISKGYLLQFPLKRKSYLVLPKHKGYLKLDPEKGRELFGQLKEGLGDNPGKIDKKERLGTEEINGYLCDKVHIMMTPENGIKTDITAWLAQTLKGFPLKIIARLETPQGIKAINTTVFTNLKKMEPEADLFEIPDGYVRYKTFLELVTEGKLGSKIRESQERKEKRKPFKRK